MTDFPAPRQITCNGIRLAVHEAGDGPAVVLLHGFPELAYSWRHQLPALAAAGYRAVAPDLRGYGGADKPAAVEAYRMDMLLADIADLIGAAGREPVVVVGHDWGALLAWQLALVRPDLLAGLACLNIPFMPRTERDPVELMRERFGPDFYIVNFQDSAEADRRFAADPARFIDRMMRRPSRAAAFSQQRGRRRPVIDLLALLDSEPAGAPLLAPAELDYYASAFAEGGFTGPINWYRNFSRNWRDTAGVEQRVRVPTLFIGAAADMVIAPGQIEAMRPHVPDLELHTLQDCGHWTQQERPDDTNRLLLDWLGRHYPARP